MTTSAIPYRQRGLASGYRYQDLVAALAMARVLAEGAGAVTVEEKRFAGDAFDDVELTAADGAVRRGQVKHREGRGPLTIALFEGDADDLRLDKLVAAETTNGQTGTAPELRVLTTLDASAAAAAGFVAEPEAPPFVAGLRSTRWRISVDGVWPEGDDHPRFEFETDVTRDEVASFCGRFVVEADVTPMSGSLAHAGELERALIERLREAVGVEQYPNRAKAIDVASRLLEVANSLRTRKQRRLDFDSIAAECGLRVDRGRIAQAFPLDRLRYVPGVPLRAALAEALDPQHGHRRIVVKGPPGAGKSWALEALAQDLRAAGTVVARHYCFLAPGDPEVAQRVAVEALTANLTAELLDDHRLTGVDAGLGGGVSTLELALTRADEVMTAAGLSDRIVLIVDGLDHAARIEPAPGRVAARPEDLTAQLGLLELPDRVTLIVGSQPGVHLDTLVARGAYEVAAPPLELRHTAALLARQGTLRALKQYGFADDHEQMIEAVHEKAAGNPLLVGFLGREVVERLRVGKPEPPSEAIAAIAAPDGDLKAYYRHLLVTTEQASDGGILAEHLALLDFAVTEAELDEIVPVLGPSRIARTVSALRPILDDAGTQGGLRIHHESFRRFMVENLIAEGRGLGPLLDPVIAWLDARGLYKDQRAFRHLLPLLRRAGREGELLDRFGHEFVSNSVAELQPEAAIDANLRLAADVAAEKQDFATLTRVAELRSATITTFEEKLQDPTFWGEAVAELEGPQRLAERLLYDGRPTWPRVTGLRLCAVVDGAGATPPWREYLEVRSPPDNVSKTREQEQRETLDQVRGMLRTFERADAISRLAAWIEDYAEIERAYVDGIAVELAGTLGPAGIVEALAAAPGASSVARATLELGLAEAYASAGETDLAMAAGGRALAAGLEAGVMWRLLDVGLPADELTVPAPDLSFAGLLSGKGPDADRVEMFLSWVFVAAARGDDLADTRHALAGDGFYLAWLRFCCDLANAVHGRAEVVAALDELADYDKPFAGSPRASDLYSIWSLTAETFRRAISLVADDEWPRALELLLTIAGNTTTSMQNHPGGPLTLWKLLELLQPHAGRFPPNPVREAVERSYRSEFYELHAEVSLRISLFEHRAGHTGRADDALATAGRYLAAYGFHKDVTVFGLVQALEAVTDKEHQARVTARFHRLFPLCDRAYRHSDGKETNHATYACFSAFAAHSPGAAADALARTLLEDPPVRYRDNERGLVAVTGTAPDVVPPLLRHLLWRCCLPADVKGWLAAVDALAAVDDARAGEAFLELAAAADGDTEHADQRVAEQVRSFAIEHDWPEPPMDAVPDRRPRSDSHNYQSANDDNNGGGEKGPFFEAVETELDLLVRFRGRFGAHDDFIDVDAFADELVARLRTVTGGDADAVVGLVASFCHEQRFLRQRGAILTRTAAAFESEPAVAAELYVLAWIGIGDGWDPFGGLEHRGLLESGFALDAEAALARLATELGRHVQLRGTMGVTRRIVEAMMVTRNPDGALACWDQAAAVVEHRLPVIAPEGRATVAEPGDDLDDAGTKRAYGRLLGSLVHSSDPERRAAAIAGIAELLPLDPGLAFAAVTSVLSTDATFTDTLLVVRLLELAADPEKLRDAAPWLPAIAAAPGFGLQRSAGALLDRLGEDMPDGVVQLPASGRVVTQPDIAKARFWDTRRRVARLADLWQPFERLVAGRYRDLREAPGTDDIIRRQVKTQFSLSATWMPPWVLHRWDAELLEIAVHDAVPELIAHMGASGRWPPGMNAKLNAMLLPDVGAAAARARSRAVRPGGVTLPGDRSAAIGPPVRAVDGAYEGWTRVALVEEEIQVSGATRSSGTLTRVASGLWAGEGPPADAAPFDTVLMEWRWHDTGTTTEDAAPSGPLAAHGDEHHLVLFDSLLTLTPGWKARLGLRPAPLPGPLDLLDSRGEVGAAMRCWRMRPYSYDYLPLTSMIRGAELLVRPDLAEAALASTDGGLREITVVTEDALRHDT